MGKLKTFFVLLLMALTGVFGESPETCNQPDSNLCLEISLLNGAPNDHQQTILEELCKAGHDHRSPGWESRNQFAVMNIHNEASADDVKWTGGDCPNVACQDSQAKWYLDNVVPLRSGFHGTGKGSYYWYQNGLPMWPILNQCHGHRRRRLSRLFRGSGLNWPNYALATPSYQVKKVCDSTGHLSIAVRKLFKSHNSTDQFSKPLKFKHFVESFMKNFLDKNGTECPDEARKFENLEDYSRWLKTLVITSLRSMLKSAKHKAKKCPAELFIFFRKKPDTGFAEQLKKDVVDILKGVECPKMSIIIGYNVL